VRERDCPCNTTKMVKGSACFFFTTHTKNRKSCGIIRNAGVRRRIADRKRSDSFSARGRSVHYKLRRGRNLHSLVTLDTTGQIYCDRIIHAISSNLYCNPPFFSIYCALCCGGCCCWISVVDSCRGWLSGRLGQQILQRAAIFFQTFVLF